MTLPEKFEQIDASPYCAKCGECCTTLPGCLAPSDIGEITVDSLVKLFKTGKYAVDWWEGFKWEGRSHPGYFIRPKAGGRYGSKEFPSQIKDPSWGGRCIFLTDSGCELEFKDRPWNCRALIPRKDKRSKDCHFTKNINPKRYCAELWAQYADLIDQALSEVGFHS